MNTTEQKTTEKKVIDVASKQFMANGRKYLIMDWIPIRRFREYEKLSVMLGFNCTFKQMWDNHQKLYAALNQQKFADSAVLCHNIMNGISRLNDEKRQHPALLACALVIIREEEDITKYEETLMLDKINDWQLEGLDMKDFLELALNSIPGFRETFTQYTLQVIGETKEVIEGEQN